MGAAALDPSHGEIAMSLIELEHPLKRRRQGVSRRAALLWLGAGSAALACARALAEPVIKSVDALQPGEFTWHPERAPSGPGCDRRLDPRPARLRLPERRPHRGLDLLDRQARPQHADRRLHHPAEGQEPPVEHLQQRADAEHEPADLVGHRASCRPVAGLSGLAWLRPSADRFLGKALHRHPGRHPGDHRRRGDLSEHRGPSGLGPVGTTPAASSTRRWRVSRRTRCRRPAPATPRGR